MILPDDKLSQRQVRSALYLKTTGEQAAIGSKLERLFIPDTTLADQQLIDTFLPHILENEAKGVLQDMLAQHALAMQCSGLMKPDTHLGENARQIEVADDQTTPLLYS